MGCENCSYRGIKFGDENGTISTVSEADQKLQTRDWLKDYTRLDEQDKVYEIRFKNTRKEYFRNPETLLLKKGDVVAVEAQGGHDIGTISLSGKLAWLQLKKKAGHSDINELKRIYRKATPYDLKTYREAVDREQSTMIRSRQIIKELGLEMKLGDVEYQGDNSKCIFYYIAEERVDFRELIKILAREFRIRVEMKQIGARQEAGRIGGIGSCGRELCCSTWKTNFQSVTLNAARVQDLPANAQKLAGQCGKLKCCLMYELDTYLEAKEEIPAALLELETVHGIAYHHKTDTLNRMMYYSLQKETGGSLIPVPVERVKEIINLNKKGEKVGSLLEKQLVVSQQLDYVQSSDSIDRFENPSKSKRKKRKSQAKHTSAQSAKNHTG